ncbi:hypothetical protein GF325_15595 [Candidatus Bathyarchaeota archaeon]|nr:hypothetical protein [Candidatus Bathyarchaeota archaeon]
MYEQIHEYKDNGYGFTDIIAGVIMITITSIESPVIYCTMLYYSTSVMKAEDVRLAILKQLKVAPSYGYELYTMLSDELDIKNPSELYKILRSLKTEGYVDTLRMEKQSGRDREILRITEGGKHHYFDQVYESASFFINLISESMLERIASTIVSRFKEWGLDFIFQGRKDILVDFSYSLENQLILINNVSTMFENEPNFYLVTSVEERESLGRLTGLSPRMNLLNRKMALKRDSIDLVLIMAPVEPDRFTRPGGIKGILREDGMVIIATFKDNVRRMTPVFSKGLHGFFNTVFDEPLAKKLSDSFSSFLIPNLLSKGSLTSSEIERHVDTHFKECRKLGNQEEPEISFLDIYYGRFKKS